MADNSADMILFQELERKRLAIVNEINTYTAVLEGNRNVGMHGPLLDSEGFPRSDIDVVAVRTARNRIICLFPSAVESLNTDHNEVMKQLEAVSARLLSKTQAGVEGMNTDFTATVPSSEPPSRSVPFLLVDQVTPGSPADLAGICVDDRVTRFGSILASNFTGLQAIAAVVKSTKPKVVTPDFPASSCLDPPVSALAVSEFNKSALNTSERDLVVLAGHVLHRPIGGGLKFHWPVCACATCRKPEGMNIPEDRVALDCWRHCNGEMLSMPFLGMKPHNLSRTPEVQMTGHFYGLEKCQKWRLEAPSARRLDESEVLTTPRISTRDYYSALTVSAPGNPTEACLPAVSCGLSPSTAHWGSR
ncbi:26S proteasome non-ATPase regulatory subunit 9 [Echinococcus granulosus]|uniref:26S proteasome non-ATPase regulatory subunit 9 n=1 Tax=Echinococcus granulosus TaxID=6210 RepID=W6UVU1_ECHGR|nr:26S proteasome non-ATPase regulatory subunit 9 [Echinococcus granulosus]EUB62512.1 26S proteasome non-ATPase regulatory subunit 9 [Echinococcus granulosus]